MSKVVPKEKHAMVKRKEQTRIPVATQTERREQEHDDVAELECPDEAQNFLQTVPAGPVIVNFEKWLRSPDDGKRNKKNSYTRYVERS